MFDPSGDFGNLTNNLKSAYDPNPQLGQQQAKTARSMALQNALNSLKGQDISMQGQEQNLSNASEQGRLDQMKPGLMDYLMFGAIGTQQIKNSFGKNKDSGKDTSDTSSNTYKPSADFSGYDSSMWKE